jgi:4,5-dihydroxyphthalate decarboxylase
MTIAFPSAGPVTLRTNLQDYPQTRPLKSGEVRSDLVSFDFAGPKSAFEGFKPMVREGKFDAGELAIITFLQAKAYGKPLVLLPAVIMGRYQHQCMLVNAKLGALAPKDIEGRRIGVRSYTQTTGAWVRGILQHEYGVDLSRVTWVVHEDAHLAEYRDPPGVERLPPGSPKVDEVFLNGELDGAILGNDLPNEPRVRHLIPNPLEAADAWRKKYGTTPINHLFVVNKALSDTRPDVVREIYRLLVASKKAAPAPKDGIDFLPFGVEANRKALELIIQYAVEQKLIPRRFTVDELFDDTTRALGP